MDEATNMTIQQMVQQFMQQFGNAPVGQYAQGRDVSGGSGNVGGMNINIPSYSQPAPTWNASNIYQALPPGTSFGGGAIIPFGQPQRETTAQDMAAMVNEAARIAQYGGYGAPTPPEGMPVEDYLSFLSSLNSMRAQMQVDRRGDEALGAIRGEFTTMSGDPALAQARQIAGQGGMDWDIYEAMRRSLEAQTNPNASGMAAAASGTAGSSAAQLAGNQARTAFGSALANIYPAALQAGQQLRTGDIQNTLMPFYARQQVGSDYLNNYTSALRAMFGQPEFILS